MAIDRISSYGSNAYLVSRLLRTQSSLQQLETQVASEKTSQNYAGISLHTERLINMENEITLLDRFIVSNESFDVRIQTTKTIVSGIQLSGETSPSGGIQEILKDFRSYLLDFDSGLKTYSATLTNEQLDDLEFRTTNLQKRAYESMVAMKNFLNEAVGGQFLFSGTKTDTQPVDIETGSQGAFQAVYDGDSRLYPWTRDSHVDTNLTTAAATTGALTFDLAGGTITAANAGTLSSIPVGSLVTLNGGDNDTKTVTVVSNTGTVINFTGNVDYTGSGGTAQFTVNAAADLTDAGASADPTTLSVAGYYDGNEESLSHRVDTNQSIDFDVNAADPAFEKGLRAIGIILQGAWGSTSTPATGNLARHPDRIEEALWLIDAALSLNTTGTPPYGTDDISTANKANLEQMELDIGFHEIVIESAVTRHTQLTAMYADRIGDIEDIDLLQSVTELQDQARALEASYQALSRVRQMSLSNFL